MKFINHKTGYVLYTPLGLLNGQWVQFDGLFHSKNLSMTGEWVVGGGRFLDMGFPVDILNSMWKFQGLIKRLSTNNFRVTLNRFCPLSTHPLPSHAPTIKMDRTLTKIK